MKNLSKNIISYSLVRIGPVWQLNPPQFYKLLYKLLCIVLIIINYDIYLIDVKILNSLHTHYYI